MTYTINRKNSGADIGSVEDGILGACNSKMAHQAISIEPRVGAMLPCNVILREVEGGVEISAIDPVASMQEAIDNAALHAVAGQVPDMLIKVVKNV